MMRAMYTRFAKEHGLEPFNPPPFSVLKYQKEIERLERAYNTHFNTLWNMVSKAKFALMQRFFETIASRVKHVYEIANRDVEAWLKAVMSPLETQVREHHLQLRRRLDSIKRIHHASGELEERIAELEQQEDAIRAQGQRPRVPGRRHRRDRRRSPTRCRWPPTRDRPNSDTVRHLVRLVSRTMPGDSHVRGAIVRGAGCDSAALFDSVGGNQGAPCVSYNGFFAHFHGRVVPGTYIMRFRSSARCPARGGLAAARAAIPATETGRARRVLPRSRSTTTSSRPRRRRSPTSTPACTRAGRARATASPSMKAGSTYAGSLAGVPLLRQAREGHRLALLLGEGRPSARTSRPSSPTRGRSRPREVFRAFPVDAARHVPGADTTAASTGCGTTVPTSTTATRDQLVRVLQFMVGKGYTPEGDGNPAFPVAFCAPTGGSVVPPPAAGAPNCTVTASSADAGARHHGDAHRHLHERAHQLRVGRAARARPPRAGHADPSPARKTYTLYASNAQGPGAPVAASA